MSDPRPPEAAARHTQGPSSAILTAPNGVTLLRLLLIPACAWMLASRWYGPGLVFSTLVGLTDWVDGWLARRTGQVSKVGQLLDPLADRLLIAVVAIVLLIDGVLPWLAVTLLLVRDGLLLASWPLLARLRLRPPEVIWLGKATTMDLMLALAFLVLGETSVPVTSLARGVGTVMLWVGVVLYYVVGVIYVRMTLAGLTRRSRAGS